MATNQIIHITPPNPFKPRLLGGSLTNANLHPGALKRQDFADSSLRALNVHWFLTFLNFEFTRQDFHAPLVWVITIYSPRSGRVPVQKQRTRSVTTEALLYRSSLLSLRRRK